MHYQNKKENDRINSSSSRKKSRTLLKDSLFLVESSGITPSLNLPLMKLLILLVNLLEIDSVDTTSISWIRFVMLYRLQHLRRL